MSYRTISYIKMKLTPAQVIEMRARKQNGETLAAIAKRFDVSVGTVSSVVNRKSWVRTDKDGVKQAKVLRALRTPGAVLPGEKARRQREGRARRKAHREVIQKTQPQTSTQHAYRERNRKLSNEDVVNMRELADTGRVSLAELASRFRVTKATVLSTVFGVSWRDLPGPIQPLPFPFTRDD